MMSIKDLMTVDVEVVDRDASLHECAYIMKCAGVGSLPVVDQEKVVGVITDRDIVVRALAEGLDCMGTKVRRVMTPDVVTCPEDTDIGEARRLMSAYQVGRLVVVDEEGQLAGIVVRADLAERDGELDADGIAGADEAVEAPRAQ